MGVPPLLHNSFAPAKLPYNRPGPVGASARPYSAPAPARRADESADEHFYEAPASSRTSTPVRSRR